MSQSRHINVALYIVATCVAMAQLSAGDEGKTQHDVKKQAAQYITYADRHLAKLVALAHHALVSQPLAQQPSGEVHLATNQACSRFLAYDYRARRMFLYRQTISAAGDISSSRQPINLSDLPSDAIPLRFEPDNI